MERGLGQPRGEGADRGGRGMQSSALRIQVGEGRGGSPVGGQINAGNTTSARPERCSNNPYGPPHANLCAPFCRLLFPHPSSPASRPRPQAMFRMYRMYCLCFSFLTLHPAPPPPPSGHIPHVPPAYRLPRPAPRGPAAAVGLAGAGRAAGLCNSVQAEGRCTHTAALLEGVQCQEEVRGGNVCAKLS